MSRFDSLCQIFASLVDKPGAAFGVGLSFFGIAFRQEGKELVVARELCQIFTSGFDADARATFHVVRVDE